MGFLDLVKAIKSFLCYDSEPELKVANVSIFSENAYHPLLLVVLTLEDRRLFGAEDPAIILEYFRAWECSTSWESIIGEIKYKFFYLGGPQIVHRVWRDYGKMNAVVYIVSARTRRQFLQQKEELHTLLFDMETFANVPFLIFFIRYPGINLSEEQMVILLDLNNVTTGRDRVPLANANVRPLEVFVVEESNREQYLEGIEWLSYHLTNN